MALPSAPQARPFYRSAHERLDDARILMDAGRTTGAVYLAGYAVECMLKALIIDAVPPKRQPGTVEAIRSHDLLWLRGRYLAVGAAGIDKEIRKTFAAVMDWDTGLRYQGRRAGSDEARQFLGAVERIMSWAEGRF